MIKAIERIRSMESSLATILLQEGFRDDEDLGENCAHFLTFRNTLSAMLEKIENLEIFDALFSSVVYVCHWYFANLGRDCRVSYVAIRDNFTRTARRRNRNYV